MDEEIKEIEDIDEEIIEDQITETTLEEVLEEAPMLEEENKDLKAKIAELEKAIEVLTTKEEETEEKTEEEEKSLEDSIKEILERQLSEVPERKGIVKPEEMEEKFVETKVTIEDMVKVIDEMPPEERKQMFIKWKQTYLNPEFFAE